MSFSVLWGSRSQGLPCLAQGCMVSWRLQSWAWLIWAVKVRSLGLGLCPRLAPRVCICARGGAGVAMGRLWVGRSGAVSLLSGAVPPSPQGAWRLGHGEGPYPGVVIFFCPFVPGALAISIFSVPTSPKKAAVLCCLKEQTVWTEGRAELGSGEPHTPSPSPGPSCSPGPSHASGAPMSTWVAKTLNYGLF